MKFRCTIPFLTLIDTVKAIELGLAEGRKEKEKENAELKADKEYLDNVNSA